MPNVPYSPLHPSTEIADLQRQLGEARARLAAMEKPLRMWAATPGNRRKHVWWLEWEKQLTEALAALPPPPEEDKT